MNRQPEIFIGRDVCDKNPRSRDAVVILERQKQLVGKPGRDNLQDPSLIKEMITGLAKGNFPHQDPYNALICVLTGWLYFFSSEKLIQPTTAPIDGRIFAPADGIVK